MKKLFQAAVVTAAVLALPAMSMAAQAKPAAAAKTPATQASSAQASTPAKPAAKARTAKAAPAAAAHTARGVVKSMDASSLVISQKAGKTTKEMSFVLDNSTQKEGDVAVGSSVQVTYHNAAKLHHASAVKVTSAKKS